MSSKAVSWECVEIACEESALRFLYLLNLMKELNLIVIVLTVIGWYYQAFTAHSQSLFFSFQFPPFPFINRSKARVAFGGGKRCI